MSGKAPVAESMWESNKHDSIELDKGRDLVRCMLKGRGAVSAGEDPTPTATEGAVADRTRGVRPCLVRRWESTRAENRAESSSGTRGEASRSEDDDDATMSDARRAAFMSMPATAQ